MVASGVPACYQDSTSSTGTMGGVGGGGGDGIESEFQGIEGKGVSPWGRGER